MTFPAYIHDPSAIHLMSSLLERSPEMRLGSGVEGAKEIKCHPFFQGFSWDAIISRQLEPPWKPDMASLMRKWKNPSEVEESKSPSREDSIRSSRCYTAQSQADPDWDKDF